MKEFETEYISKIIEIMKNNGLTEVTLEDEDKSLVIKGGSYIPVIEQKVEETVNEVEEIEEETEIISAKRVPVISNMIGIFYAGPEPGAEPFVKPGDTVKEGQVICLIETIKFMNKITAGVSGKVTEICIEDGKPVEYGQIIMYIEEE